MLAKLFKYNIPLHIFLGSTLVTLLILSQCFFGISEIVFGNTWPFKILLLIGSFVGFFYSEKHFQVKQFAVLFGVSFFFLLTFITENNSFLLDYFIDFLVYGGSAFLLSFSKINEKIVFWSCVIFGFFWLGLFLITNHFIVEDTFYFGYTILPLVVASFLLLTYKDKNILRFVVKLILFMIAAALLVLKGSRGPVVCFLFFLFIHFLPYIKKWKGAIIYFSILAVFVVLLINIEGIVTALHDAMPGKISFIDKTYDLLTKYGEVSNSRFAIIAEVFSEYGPRDLIFGIGIGNYAATHPQYEYTHNIFISIMLDCGIIGVLFALFIVVLFFYFIFKRSDERRYSELLFSVSFITLLFSGNYWKFFTFWLVIFYMLNVTNMFFGDIRKIQEKISFKRKEHHAKKTC